MLQVLWFMKQLFVVNAKQIVIAFSPAKRLWSDGMHVCFSVTPWNLKRYGMENFNHYKQVVNINPLGTPYLLFWGLLSYSRCQYDTFWKHFVSKVQCTVFLYILFLPKLDRVGPLIIPPSPKKKVSIYIAIFFYANYYPKFQKIIKSTLKYLQPLAQTF